MQSLRLTTPCLYCVQGKSLFVAASRHVFLFFSVKFPKKIPHPLFVTDPVPFDEFPPARGSDRGKKSLNIYRPAARPVRVRFWLPREAARPFFPFRHRDNFLSVSFYFYESISVGHRRACQRARIDTALEALSDDAVAPWKRGSFEWPGVFVPLGSDDGGALRVYNYLYILFYFSFHFFPAPLLCFSVNSSRVLLSYNGTAMRKLRSSNNV